MPRTTRSSGNESDSERLRWGITSSRDRRWYGRGRRDAGRQKKERACHGAHHDGCYLGEPEDRSGDYSHDDQAVFNVVACLQRVVPEVEGLRDMAAKTNQQKQKRTELKTMSPHFTVLSRCKFRVRKRTHHPTILVAFT